MTEVQREIRLSKRVIEYAEKIGNVGRACRHFGIARSTFYLWRDRYRESGDEGLKSRRFGCHHNHPKKTLRVYAHALREEETGISASSPLAAPNGTQTAPRWEHLS
ncbi:MAG: helix-turn-helix domain-containing protein [Deltaproteobacteria bacterium]|nr:helix-turn-helix domain-containing protein [Deltaproteobacteria bacterium]